MKEYQWSAFVVSMLLAACSFTAQSLSPIATPVIFEGRTLPPPPELGLRRPPPPAWLLLNDALVLATFGSFTIRHGGHGGAADYADAPSAERMPSPLATVWLAQDRPAELVIGPGSLPPLQTVKSIAVTVRPWQASFAFAAPLQQRPLAARSAIRDGVTVFSLPSFGEIKNQVVQAEVTFVGDSQASYV